MKRMKVLGIVALALAGIVLLGGVFSLLLRSEVGPFAPLMDSSKQAQAQVSASMACMKAVDSALRKADAAVAAADKAAEEAAEAQAALDAALEALGAHTEDGDPLHALYYAVEDARVGMDGTNDAVAALDALLAQLAGEGGSLSEGLAALGTAADTADEAVARAQYAADTLLLTSLRESLSGATAAVEKADDAAKDARSAVAALEGVDAESLPDVSIFPFAVEPPDTVAQSVQLEATTLAEHASWLQKQVAPIQAAAAQAASVREVASVSRQDSIINWIATYYIAIWFTAVLLLAVGVLLTFFSDAFMRQWKGNAVFSVFMALVLMLVVQTFSMRFTYDTFGEWGRAWLDNAFNVLRANTSVGMIALGMTLVIITGGIDLAVGSTLAGVGTVVMVLIDTSSRGILTNLGITGTPAFIIGVLGGFAAGALIGALIGLGVTKGRVPPFIITLGVMNIVRSVAQYFTKSYTPKVPPAFTGIANTVIFGQRLLPIVYWLVLAVILYFVMKRTRFGRYVYAVGSNERTTRLSGINVDMVKFKVYTLMGFLVSVAAVTQVSRLGGMDVASAGSGYELDAIAAVVVGGTSMSGGRGSIVGTVIGVLIIGVMNNLLILLGVDSFLTNAFKGAIVVAAVLMQRKQA